MIEIISMKQHGASMKFKISLEHASEKEMSKEHNIYNIVCVRFETKVLRLKDFTGMPQFSIAMKKHELAKDWIFTVNVACNILDFSKIVNCSVNWYALTLAKTTIDELVEVDVQINIIKTYSPANEKNHEDETLTDFQLSAKDGSVAVHREYLAAHSDVFNTMLHGEWKETAQGRMELKGVTRQTLQHFKDFMYLGTLPDEDDELRPLLLLADRYLVKNLKTVCIMKMMQTITPENLDSRIEFVVENQMHDLKDNILEKIPAEIFASAYALKVNALMGKIESSSSPAEE